MTRLRTPNDNATLLKSKYDDCILQSTGRTPKFNQKASGRTAVLGMIDDGMSVGQLSERAVSNGFDSKFALDCVLKHTTLEDARYTIVPPDGRSIDELRAKRGPRERDPNAPKRARKTKDGPVETDASVDEAGADYSPASDREAAD